jgi:hypothetical protein
MQSGSECSGRGVAKEVLSVMVIHQLRAGTGTPLQVASATCAWVPAPRGEHRRVVKYPLRPGQSNWKIE